MSIKTSAYQVSAYGRCNWRCTALFFFEGIDIAEHLFYNVSIGGLNLSKEELKREIVELVDQIDSEKILKLIAGFVKSGYKEEQAGK